MVTRRRALQLGFWGGIGALSYDFWARTNSATASTIGHGSMRHSAGATVVSPRVPAFGHQLSPPRTLKPDRYETLNDMPEVLQNEFLERLGCPSASPLPRDALEGIFPIDLYYAEMREVMAQVLPPPFPQTPVWVYTYGDMTGPVSVIEARGCDPDEPPGFPSDPLRRNRACRTVVIRQEHRLPTSDNMSIHLHGSHTPPAWDGHPHEYAANGEECNVIGPQLPYRYYLYPNDQVAATLWYHDHMNDQTAQHVFKGLASFYLIRDKAEDGFVFDPRASAPESRRFLKVERGLNLPSWDRPEDVRELPVNDPRLLLRPFEMPLVLQDRVFNADGSLHYDPAGFDGVLGDTFLVNGLVQPFMKVQRRRYRFRILNGANARLWDLAFSLSPSSAASALRFFQIGAEGSLATEAVELEHTGPIIMAERIDLIFDFGKVADSVSEVFLVNCLQQTDGRKPDGLKVDACTPLLKFQLVGNSVVDASFNPRDGDPVRPVNPPPKGAPASALLLEEKDATVTRTWRFDRSGGVFTINGLPFENSRVDAFVREDAVEIWRFVNDSGGWVHPAHPHLTEFRILDRNGQPPPRQERVSQKETFLIGRNETVRVIGKFRNNLFFRPDEDPSRGSPLFDVKGRSEYGIQRYVFHCHNLEHEDMVMMTQFQVVKAGDPRLG